jgi:hypothetical protein
MLYSDLEYLLVKFESERSSTCAGNDRIKKAVLIFWTPGQVTELGDPPPKFGTGVQHLPFFCAPTSTSSRISWRTKNLGCRKPLLEEI